VRVFSKDPFPRGNAGTTRDERRAARAEEAVGSLVRPGASHPRFHVETPLRRRRLKPKNGKESLPSQNEVPAGGEVFLLKHPASARSRRMDPDGLVRRILIGPTVSTWKRLPRGPTAMGTRLRQGFRRRPLG
jgi:hypothetical protein